MSLNNNKGSTLVENIISILLLSIFSCMVFSTLIMATNALKEAYEVNVKVSELYAEIENDEVVGEPESGFITFTLEDAMGNQEEVIIEGYYYGDEEGLLGEFVKNEEEN